MSLFIINNINEVLFNKIALYTTPQVSYKSRKYSVDLFLPLRQNYMLLTTMQDESQTHELTLVPMLLVSYKMTNKITLSAQVIKGSELDGSDLYPALIMQTYRQFAMGCNQLKNTKSYTFNMNLSYR